MIIDTIIDWFFQMYIKAISPRLVNIKNFNKIHFECIQNCGDCCKKGLVCVVERELQGKLKDNLHVIERDSQKGVGLIMMRECEYINKTKYGDCVFLDKDRCLIYDDKPLVCNSYPLSIDPLNDEVYVDVRCKGVSKGRILSVEEIEKMVDYKRKFWKLMNLSQFDKEVIHKELFVRYIKK